MTKAIDSKNLTMIKKMVNETLELNAASKLYPRAVEVLALAFTKPLCSCCKH